MRKLRLTSLIVAAGLMAGGGAWASETGPVIVIPGKSGVPVMYFGTDISYAAVEGDWGLARPSQTDPRVIYRYYPPPLPYAVPPAHFFPSGGPPPRLGRVEANDTRPTNPNNPAPTQMREWSSHSRDTPATSPTPLDTPGMLIAPQIDLGRRWR